MGNQATKSMSVPKTTEPMASAGDELGARTETEVQSKTPEEIPELVPQPEVPTNEFVRQTVEDAKDHIARIRRDKGLDLGILDSDLGCNVSDLTAALEVLSDQLYTQPTHFLLEFIQNADDNTYGKDDDNEPVIPTISFHNFSGSLAIICNEVGFQPKNVDAICRIAQSTKKDRSKGFIGEKGIGFKSVFKIADVVHISSNSYSFRFDKKGKLGMIAPIWSDYPGKNKENHTQFFLQLSQDKNGQSEKDLRKQLKLLDSTLLLFLRNLKQISVLIDDGTGTVGGKSTKDLCRIDYEQYAGEMLRIQGDRKRYRKLVEDTEYLVVRHIATGMPTEPCRRGMSSSEVVLAFPFHNERPTFFRQKAYAFLPIRESGFKFLLQADFILIANREDMILHSDWNQALLNGLAECFVKAVDRFNHNDARPLRYTWLGFLRDLPSPDLNNFADLGEQLITALTYRSILESQSGEFVQPSNAIFVPSKYRDSDGHFLLDSPTSASHDRTYIASEYEQHDPGQNILQQLGVEVMAYPRFLEMLKAYVADDLEHYSKRSASWHSRLASVLFDMTTSIKQVHALPLIPLRDGKWVAQVECQCYFETNDSNVLSKLPEGIEDLRIVASSASEDGARRKLLTKLGVKLLDRVEVCRLLSEFHNSVTGPQLSVDSLIAHARYLYEVHRTGAHFAKPTKFWVHDTSGIPQAAASLYLDSPEASTRPLSMLLQSEEWSTLLLHPAYLKEYKGKQLEKWAKWMETYLCVRSTIRIVTSSNGFTPEFRYLLDNLETEQLLEVVFSSWHRDSASFTKVAKDMLGAVLVTCEGGGKVRLSQTCLATPSLKTIAVAGLTFLHLKDPEHARWKKLRDLGVCVVPGLQFYLRCLSLIQGTESPSRAGLVSLYRSIEAHIHEDVEAFQEYFKINAPIFIPHKKIWVNKSGCVWDATPGVSDENALSETYKELYNFFFHHLQVRSATIEKVVSQLREMNLQSEENAFLRKLLLYSLDKFLRRNPNHFSKLRPLENVPIVPIAPKQGMESHQLASLNRPTWLFADRYDYHHSFLDRSTVRFADFAVELFPDLEALCLAISKAWPVDGQHCLSTLVREEKDIGAGVVYDLKWTSVFRDKLKFLRRIVKVGAAFEIKRKLDLLHSLKVYSAPTLSVRTFLSQGQLGKSVEGAAVARQALHKTTVSDLKFYVRNDANPFQCLEALGGEFISFCNIGDGRYQYLVQSVMISQDDRQMYDILTRERIGGNEVPPYVPLPVQTLEMVPAPEPRHPLAKVSGNVKQTSAPAQIVQKEPSVTVSMPVAADGKVATATISPIPEQASDLAAMSTLRISGTTLGPKQDHVSGREALQASRLRDQQSVIQIGGTPATVPAPRPRPTDAQNYFAVYDPKSAGRPGLTGVNRSAMSNSSLPPVARQRSSPPSYTTESPNRYARAKTEADFVREQDIGIQGEVRVWDILKDVFGQDLDAKYWTSELRDLAKLNLPHWRPEDPELTYGDFTVPDRGGLLTSWLLANGVELPQSSVAATRIYHIEVKSTAGPSQEPIHMSQLQMLRCEELSGNVEEVFLVFRLFELDSGNGETEIFADPWKMIQEGRLTREPESWLIQ